MKQRTVVKEEKSIVLSQEELAALDEGIRSSETEPIYTLEESFEFARERRKS